MPGPRDFLPQPPWEGPPIAQRTMRNKTIWVGRFTDELGEFEILVIAGNRKEAHELIDKALDQLIRYPERVQPFDRITGVPALSYVEEVGTFDMVRLR